MIDAGVDGGDLLGIYKSLNYKTGALVLCFINGEFTLKGIKVEGNTFYLMPANKDY